MQFLGTLLLPSGHGILALAIESFLDVVEEPILKMCAESGFDHFAHFIFILHNTFSLLWPAPRLASETVSDDNSVVNGENL